MAHLHGIRISGRNLLAAFQDAGDRVPPMEQACQAALLLMGDEEITYTRLLAAFRKVKPVYFQPSKCEKAYALLDERVQAFVQRRELSVE
ncbi:MAG: hypothetical protein H6859_08900 [Rhodospirillales bacterium]|nr:hypothetical protein [Alphaproteobacteria bacterium]USO05256.1 MAG: hypothetical protein H6859_08900 [Rhodospirillales bacterium]